MVICHSSYRKLICPSSKPLLAQFFCYSGSMSSFQRNCPWLLQLSKYFLNESLKIIHLTLIKVEARVLKLTTMGWIQPAHVSYLTDSVFENLFETTFISWTVSLKHLNFQNHMGLSEEPGPSLCVRTPTSQQPPKAFPLTCVFCLAQGATDLATVVSLLRIP